MANDNNLVKELEEFFAESNYDVTRPLSWGHYIDKIKKDDVQSVMNEIRALGFQEVEPLLNDELEMGTDELSTTAIADSPLVFSLYCYEVAVHTPESLARRIGEITVICSKYNVQYSDWSAGLTEKRHELQEPSREIILETGLEDGTVTKVHVKKNERVEFNQLLYTFRLRKMPVLGGEHCAKRTGRILFINIKDGQAFTKNEVLVGIIPETIECSSCNSLNDPTDSYCPRCGKDLRG
ncbi:MAG: hypothetical protein ACFFD4_17820 [Candidatus Odinarchaeota archaeon]